MVEFEVKCGECGSSLSADFRASGRGNIYMDVGPCKWCLEKKGTEEYGLGKSDGIDEARKEVRV